MKSKDQRNKILNLLKEKFMAIFSLIYKMKSLDQFAIYININNGKFISLLSDMHQEIEEDKLLLSMESNPYCYQKSEGDLKVLVAYMGNTSLIQHQHNDIQEISLELINLVALEAKDLQKRLEEEKKVTELQKKCQYDGLTGLYNRETFETIYRELYTNFKEENRDLSILMLDIDNFKQVNDCYGHQFGDKILKKVADKVKINVRKNDIVARYGGEEIIIILVEIDELEASVIAERIRDSIETLRLEGVGVTISIGISNLKKDHHSNKDELIFIADKCLYRAKKVGKNNVIGKHYEYET